MVEEKIEKARNGQIPGIYWTGGPLFELLDECLAEIRRLKIPTMYWTGDETMSIDDEFDLVERLITEQKRDTTEVYTVMCARSLPDQHIEVVMKHNADVEWEWVDEKKAVQEVPGGDGQSVGQQGA